MKDLRLVGVQMQVEPGTSWIWELAAWPGKGISFLWAGQWSWLGQFISKTHQEVKESSVPPVFIIVLIISIQPEGRFWQEPEPSQATGMALAHCILGSFLEVGCHCFPPPLDVPTFASRCLHVQATWETTISERRNYGREMAGQFCLWFRLPRKPRVLWHAAQMCDMGDGFTSPARKACCGFFRPGSNPRSWVPEASMLTTRPPKPVLCGEKPVITFLLHV